MQPEYRVTCTALFDNATKRDAFYGAIKQAVLDLNGKASVQAKRADITKDDYLIPDGAVSEKIL
jgi:hypothetical protein